MTTERLNEPVDECCRCGASIYHGDLYRDCDKRTWNDNAGVACRNCPPEPDERYRPGTATLPDGAAWHRAVQVDDNGDPVE